MDLLVRVGSDNLFHQPDKIRSRVSLRQRSNHPTRPDIHRSVHIRGSHPRIIKRTLLTDDIADLVLTERIDP
jgi:hypothetical protein